MEMSYDNRPGDIWMNGEMVPWKNAQVHVLSHAMHYASAVFEGIRAYDGRIFKLTEHNERLAAGAASMDMKMPYSVAEMDAACQQVLKSQGFSDAYLRPIIWRGSEMMGVSAQTTRINAAVAVWEWPARGSRGDPAWLRGWRRRRWVESSRVAVGRLRGEETRLSEESAQVWAVIVLEKFVRR